MDKNWSAWIWVKWKPGTPSDAWEKWKGDTNVTNAWSTLGDWDCVLMTSFANPDDLEKFVWKNLRSNQWVESTNTTFAKKWW